MWRCIKCLLAGRGRRTLSCGEADSHNRHVAEPNPFSALLCSPALCKEWVWPGAHVQIWVLVIGLLPTVAKVKLLCALCCCFLRVTLVFCSPQQSHVLSLQLEVGMVVSCIWQIVVYFYFKLVFSYFIVFVLNNLLLSFLSSCYEVIWNIS